jgi:hypothetical protein
MNQIGLRASGKVGDVVLRGVEDLGLWHRLVVAIAVSVVTVASGHGGGVVPAFRERGGAITAATTGEGFTVARVVTAGVCIIWSLFGEIKNDNHTKVKPNTSFQVGYKILVPSNNTLQLA